MRFTVVTPCRNSARYLEETIRSVVDQTAVRSGRAELEYFVCDGASTDDTLDVVGRIGSPHVQFVSEPDRGMYDALTKGLKRGTGEIVSYLNAGDYYHQCAFDVVSEIFANYPDVHWLTGWNMIYNERSQLVDARLPYRYRPSFFSNGLHGRLVPGMQQESTFWRAGLHALVDFERLSQFRLAGDYFLWTQFAKAHRPRIVGAHLGGFKIHPGQLTGVRTPYQLEFDAIAGRPSLWQWMLAGLDWPIWKVAPIGVKRRLSGADHFIYDHALGKWRPYRI